MTAAELQTLPPGVEDCPVCQTAAAEYWQANPGQPTDVGTREIRVDMEAGTSSLVCQVCGTIDLITA